MTSVHCRLTAPFSVLTSLCWRLTSAFRPVTGLRWQLHNEIWPLTAQAERRQARRMMVRMWEN